MAISKVESIGLTIAPSPVQQNAGGGQLLPPAWQRRPHVSVGTHLAGDGRPLIEAKPMPESPVAYTTSIRTTAGRLFLHVHADALRKLGALDDPRSMLTTLAEQMPLLHALALRQALLTNTLDIDIFAADVPAPPAFSHPG